jgi:hypothetical protein
MITVANGTSEIVLSMRDLRGVAGYAAESAQDVLEIFERAHPADSRPRVAMAGEKAIGICTSEFSSDNPTSSWATKIVD